MIFPQSFLSVSDNSGAKSVKCIGLLTHRKSFASVGDFILVSVRSLRHGSSLRKGQIFKALVLRTKKSFSSRLSGHSFSFFSNDVALVLADSSPLSSRIFGPVSREFRSRRFLSRHLLSRRLLF